MERDQAQDRISRYLKARVPLIVIRSIEPNRVMEIVAGCAAGVRSMNFYEYSRTEGVKDLLSGQTLSDETSLAAALDEARSTFKARTNVNFVFSDVEDLDQESSTSRHMAEMVRLAESRQGSILLSSAKPLWTGLSRLGVTVPLDLPTTEELVDTLGAMVEDHRGVVDIRWQQDDLRHAAEILSGITEAEAVNGLATLLAKGQLLPEDLPELSDFKDQIFGDISGLERVPLAGDYRVGGLKNLRAWLAQREVLMRADLTATHLRPPKGVLLVGVPGCGKSLSAKAIALQFELPLYRLDMSGILGMYVGQSESQLREALTTADRVAPCVLWIDEIEKALASGSGDSGTSRRLLGQFLYWLQESTSKVFMVATANEVESLPSELLRKGRFDEMFFVDLPDQSDREEILRLYYRRYLGCDMPSNLVDELVQLTEGFSGSDIDAVVHDIGSVMLIRQTRTPPAHHEILAHFKNVIPYSQTNAEDVAAIRAWGQGRCVPAGTRTQVNGPAGQSRRVVLS